MTHEQLTDLLSRYVIPFGTEAEMQDTIARILDANGIAFQAEVSLSPRDRIDFLCGTVGIECKVDGGPSAVLEQLLRYAQHESICSLILVTRRSRQAFGVQRLSDKPLSVVWVARHL